MSPRKAEALKLLAAVLSAGVALVSGLSALDRLRLVDVLTLFFGGFGAGVGIVSALAARRQRRDAASEAPGLPPETAPR